MLRVSLDARSCAGPKLCSLRVPLLCSAKRSRKHIVPICSVKDAETFHVGQVNRATQPHVTAETEAHQTIIADGRRRAHIDISQALETLPEATVSGRGCPGDISVALLRTDSSAWKTSSATSYNVGLASLFRKFGRDSHHIYIVLLSTALLCSSWEWDVGAANAADTSVGILGPFGPMLVGLQPWDAFWFLLKYPIITLGAAALTYYVVPRAFKAIVRFLVLPALIILGLYIFVQNPVAALTFITAAISFLNEHPVGVSITILVGLGLLLSPYLLAGALGLLLITGLPNVPWPLRPAVPEPLLQAQQQFNRIRGQLGWQVQETTTRQLPGNAPALVETVQTPLRQAGERMSRLRDTVTEPVQAAASRYGDVVAGVWETAGEPLRQMQDRADRLLGDTREKVGIISGKLTSTQELVSSGLAGTQQALKSASSRLEEATACRREPTAELRMKCVEQQNAAR